VTTLITVWGASPGIGKSTLSARLVDCLAATGLRVDHFREEEILTRPEFAEVAREFGDAGTVGLATLGEATDRFVRTMLAGPYDIVVADALVPYVPTLLALGHGDEVIDTFLCEITAVLAPVCPVMVFLDGVAEVGLARAAEREGPGWLDWYVGKLAGYGVSPPVSGPESAADYLRRERRVTLDAVARHGWSLVLVERSDELTPDQVLAVVEQRLATARARHH
jgi:hypothetical protein